MTATAPRAAFGRQVTGRYSTVRLLHRRPECPGARINCEDIDRGSFNHATMRRTSAATPKVARLYTRQDDHYRWTFGVKGSF